MGHSAKVTRGGNKKRVNQGRLDAKLRAQGAKAHTTSVKESVEARRRLKQRAIAIADELKAKATATSSSKTGGGHVGAGGTPIVRMAPRPLLPKKPAAASPKQNEEQPPQGHQ